ncbi:hypothetical protein [Asticcacaulis sp. AND118]|uniref:hypothetical protein n=1 Tax=Asticcacaulis sp. AND118 TaxID=2840468 RepID=UPI001CFF65A1|nr:hypothetical protein [Asticcacaulis sp. AND118]UDF03913.1 hypothetical protein LH365_02405 [Asticcacaulis sp. AND118]
MDIDYLHFPTMDEAGKALNDETIPAQSLIHLTCIADEAGKLSDCRAETNTPLAPLAAATVPLFETAAGIKPVKGKSVSAPYPIRLSYIWAATA